MADTPYRHHSVTCKLADLEYVQLLDMRAKLSLSTAEILMIGVRHCASRYAQEQRRQRRQEPQHD